MHENTLEFSIAPGGARRQCIKKDRGAELNLLANQPRDKYHPTEV
jgi:hypothetical protein